jgi:acetolactate synthase-1/2/3 large subunit
MRVSDYIAKFLVEKKVDLVFTITGAGILRLIESVSEAGIKYVCPHHEQAAVMAALARYRITGRPAVCLVTGGPGAANTLIAVADAYLDSIPCIIIAGQEKLEYVLPKNSMRGKGVQGLDMVDIMNSVTKFGASLSNPGDIRRILEEAFHAAFCGRPGPVWIEIPQDLQWVDIDPSTLKHFTVPENNQNTLSLQDAAKATLGLLKDSKRPLIWLGHGVRLANCVDAARSLLNTLRVPALASWQGADILTDDHPFYVGRAGIYGQRWANLALQNCDLLITLGTRLAIPQRGYVDSEFARAAKKVIVEIDPDELGKYNFKVDIPVLADVSDFINATQAEIFSEDYSVNNYSDWMRQCEGWHEKYPMTNLPKEGDESINSYWFIDKLSEHLRSDDIIVTDMGTSLTCTHAAIRLKEGQRLITSTGLGEMGYGLPAAIGAALGEGGMHRVILICGEGSLMMNLQELQTVSHLNLSIKIFLLNNNGYLTIKHTHKALYGSNGDASATGPTSGVSFPNFAKLAPAFDLTYRCIKTSAGLDNWIEDLLNIPGGVFGDVLMPEFQELIPKLSVKVKENGSVYSPPLEDMYPYLTDSELESEMIIPVLRK